MGEAVPTAVHLPGLLFTNDPEIAVQTVLEIILLWEMGKDKF